MSLTSDPRKDIVTGNRTVLLTGAAGVVGNALLSHWRGRRVVCLTHRAAVPAECVRGDLRRPSLGLSSATRRRLARQVDAVVHCAAVTDFNADPADVQRINVDGTRAVADLAADAGVPLYYLSTAFVARTGHALDDTGDAAADPGPYLRSKHAAEQLVRESGATATIIRPSLVIGDSRSGEMAKFQGLHALAGAILRGMLPLVPLRAEDRIDMVPQDRLAGAIAALVDAGTTGGEYWITAGDRALTAQDTVDLTVQAGRRVGVAVDPPRLVDPEMVDRLIRPVFVEPLPDAARRRFDDLTAMTALFTTGAALPSNLDEVTGCASLTTDEVATAYRRSVEHLARSRRLDNARRAA